jgi:uncharacterized protein YjiS (DUF1127 family)
MPKLADHTTATSRLHDLLGRWHAWRQRCHELDGFDRVEMEHIASDLGLSTGDLKTLVAKGSHAADLLYERMAVLGLSRSDAERIADGSMRDLQRTCALCCNKDACRKDLAARPHDPVWKGYCPNSLSLASLSKMNERHPA